MWVRIQVPSMEPFLKTGGGGGESGMGALLIPHPFLAIECPSSTRQPFVKPLLSQRRRTGSVVAPVAEAGV